MKKYYNFINETKGVNDGVIELTEIIYNEVLKNLTELNTNGKLILQNILQNNSKNILFINDTLTFYKNTNFNSGIVSQKDSNDKIDNLNIKFNVDLTKIKKFKEIINHELNHVIEHFYSKNLSKDWGVYLELKKHQMKYEKFTVWYDISMIFYETLSHELQSRTSQTYNYIKSKNTKDVTELKKLILNSPEYLKLKNISKINPYDIIKNMKINYPDHYEIILRDLLENVFNMNYSEDNFVKLINKIKTKTNKQKKKLMKIISLILYENSEYIVYDEFKDVNYNELINKIENIE